MKNLRTFVSAAFAAAVLAAASTDAGAYAVWPDVDFEWYANVGKPVSGTTIQVFPAPREGFIWSPGHWETRGNGQAWVDGQWVADDYNQQVAVAIRDREGNVIPTNPSAYPIDSTRR